ncbi:MAG: GNAT family N-acetyltransferase [Polyangiaceae bacterium]
MSADDHVTTRRAAIDDLDAIVPLFDGYRRFYEQPADLEGARRFIGARLQAGDSAIFVAERDRHPIGFTQLYPSFSSAWMKRVWVLNDLFVGSAHRGRGFGKALIIAAEAFARGGGAKGLVLATQKTNSIAKALYEAQGWQIDGAFDHYHRFF